MAYRDRYNLEPLRIRAWLRTGVVSDRFLPLDGIMLFQTHRWQNGPQDVSIPGDYSGHMKIATLPFGMVHSGRRNWYYQCSWAQWSHDIEGTDHWNKRFDNDLADLIDFGKRRGKVIIEQADYKAYHFPVYYRVARWVEWYAVGDKADIEAHLSTCTNIGKKTVQGWGRVYKWVVESCPEDWSVWDGGKLMRGIPAEDVPPGMIYNLGNYGIRPSYWNRKNQMPLAMPL